MTRLFARVMIGFGLAGVLVVVALAQESGSGWVGIIDSMGKIPSVRSTFLEPPQLSDLERAKLENVQLQQQLAQARAQLADCQTTLGPLEARARTEAVQQATSDLVSAIEAAHEGYTFDPQTGRLVPTPEKKEP